MRGCGARGGPRSEALAAPLSEASAKGLRMCRALSREAGRQG